MAQGETRGEQLVALAGVAVVFAVAAGSVLVGPGDAVGTQPMRVTPTAACVTLTFGAALVVTLRAVRGGGTPIGTDWSSPVMSATQALLVPAGCLALLVISPAFFDSIAREDGFVEWVGVVATASGCVWAARSARHHDGALRVLLVVAAVVLFVLTGEELSWLQRLGEFGTPDVLAGNVQDEANLHNLATGRVQALYYLATSAALVVLPFVARWTSVVPQRFGAVVPSATVVVLAASSTPLAYARTGNLVHHVTFWTALGVVAWWARTPRPAWTLVTIGLVIGGQALLWTVGPDLARPWAPDEYREMLLALALALWAREVLVRSRTTKLTSHRAVTRSA